MYSFELELPTKVVFGDDSIQKLGEITAGFGKKAMLVTYDKALMEQIGLYEKAVQPLKAAGIEVVEFFGVKSNPTVEHARKGIQLAKAEKPDVIIAYGGGSAIDEAKTISVGAFYDCDVWDLCTGAAPIVGSIPLIAVVTIPATSSELNNIAVINNDEIKRKDGFGSPYMFPKVAVLDPKLTYSIPLKQTAYSAADIISHAFEGYLTHDDTWVPFQDRYCEAVVSTIMECMDKILVNPADADARSAMMWTASYTWNGFYVRGLGPIDNPIHVLGHSLSAFYDLPHGAAMSITILAYMKTDIEARKARFARFARNVMGVTETDDLKAAKLGIDLLEAWFKKIGTPTNFKEAGMPVNEVDELAADALKTANAWGLGELWTKERALKMFTIAL